MLGGTKTISKTILVSSSPPSVTSQPGPGTCLPTNKHSSQTKWSAHRYPPVSTTTGELKIPGRHCLRQSRMIFLIPAGRIRWKLFIIKAGELQGSCWADWICFGFDVGLANSSLLDAEFVSPSLSKISTKSITIV